MNTPVQIAFTLSVALGYYIMHTGARSFRRTRLRTRLGLRTKRQAHTNYPFYDAFSNRHRSLQDADYDRADGSRLAG